MLRSLCIGIVAGALVLAGGAPGIAGVDQWEFDGDLSAYSGSGTLTVEGTGTVEFTTETIGGRTAEVARVPSGTYLRAAHGFSPNGGGSYVNQYTLVMDVMFPDTSAGYASLLQTNPSNSNDGDWFVKHEAGVGISGNYGGVVEDGVWHRLALVVDLVAGTFTAYVNGVQAMQNTGLSLDGRWSLDPESLLFADEDGETAEVYVNSVQFRDAALPASAIAALGGPTAGGIPRAIVEDFEQPDGPPEGWVVTGPSVTVESGTLVLQAQGSVEVGTVVGVGGQPLWIDRFVRIEAQIAFPGDTGSWPFDHGGIFFCAQAPAGRYGTTCYVVDYLAQDPATPEVGRFRLAKFVNGAEQPLTQTPVTITDYEGLWAIDLTDAEIVFTLDGVELIRYANADLRGGYMGFWAYQVPVENRMTVDDLAVTFVPGDCPGFLTSKVSMTTGKANEFAIVRIPTGANFAKPYTFTLASADPGVAAPVGHTGGALEVTVGVGELPMRAVEIAPGDPGETLLTLSAGGVECAGATAFVETLGLFAYEETFTQPDGPPEGWYIASQSALVVGEVLSLTRGTADPFVWYAIQGVPVKVAKMESLTCRIKFARTTETGVGVHGGMVLAPEVTAARAKGYMIDVIERASDNGYRIYKDNNAGVQLGGPRPPYVWDDQFHEWKVTFTPTGFTFSVDGAQLADVQDLTYRGGYLAFWCYTGSNQPPQGQNLFVDDIRIEFGASYCGSISPAEASNRPVNPKTVFTVTAPYGSNFASDYSLRIVSEHPDVAVPAGAAGGELVLVFPRGTPLQQTFEAECLSPGTTRFYVVTEGATCPNSFATFTVPEPGLPELCEQFSQPDGPPTGWTPYAGDWQVTGGKLTVTCSPGGTPYGETWIWAGDPPVKFEGAATYEFAIELSQVTPDAVGAHGGLMLFASAPRNRGTISGYEIDWIDRASDHGYRMIRYDDGVPTGLVVGPSMPASARPGTIWLVEIDGDAIRLYADGEYIFEVADPTYREGHFGFWTYCNTTRMAIDSLGIGVDCIPPAASFTATPESGNPPLEVFFDASASTDNVEIASYSWDFGDETAGSGVQATHTYAAPGAYTVVLTVADAAGNVATAEKVVSVADTAAPVASFTATPESGTAPLEVSFDASASTDNVEIASYSWDFGDETAGSGVQATHTYAAPGAYTVVLTVADAAGNVATAEKVISVAAAGGRQKPMDMNQDARYDLSDAVAILNYLFLGGAAPPCGDQTLSDPANLALLNANADGSVDLSDAVYALSFLFLGGPRPVMCADDECPCIVIPGCPDNPTCP
ncbi:MAG: PKD domain-containing protein [Planctomycetota bacterium]